MVTETTIEIAIARSASHNETVKIEVHGIYETVNAIRTGCEWTGLNWRPNCERYRFRWFSISIPTADPALGSPLGASPAASLRDHTCQQAG